MTTNRTTRQNADVRACVRGVIHRLGKRVVRGEAKSLAYTTTEVEVNRVTDAARVCVEVFVQRLVAHVLREQTCNLCCDRVRPAKERRATERVSNVPSRVDVVRGKDPYRVNVALVDVDLRRIEVNASIADVRDLERRIFE